MDNHYATDECAALLKKLTYSKDDEKYNRPPKHKIPIDGNIYDVTQTYKSAVKLYVEFKKSNEPINESTRPVKVRKRDGGKEKLDWPTWELPAEDEVYQLAQVSTKYIHFLHPEIIGLIVEDNKNHETEWHDLLQNNNIYPDLYIWNSSPCCFPGVRRYAGSKEIAHFRKQIKLDSSDIPHALQLDDNDFPKQIWSHVFRGETIW